MTGQIAALTNLGMNARLSELALGRILDRSLGAIISIIDRHMRLVYVNERFAASFDTTPEHIIGKTLTELYGEKQISTFEKYVERVLAGEFVTYDRLGPVAGSPGVWHTVALAPWRDETGAIIGAVHSAMRVHELKITVEALRVANQKLSFHMDHSPLTMIELDGDLRLTKCSPQITALLGLDSEKMIGLPLSEIFGTRDALRSLYDSLESMRRGAVTSCQIDAALTHRNGQTVHSEWFCSALTHADASVSSIFCLIHDTTARVVAEAQLHEQATTDVLTGLLNRRAFYERLGQAAARASRSSDSLSLLFIDLDGFKEVNDRFGHDAGDEVLREVARRLKHVCRASDVIARVGGDEFVVLAEADTSRATIEALSARLAQTLRFHFPVAGGEAAVSVSIGVACEPSPTCAPGSLVHTADAAMYVAKRAGRGCVRFA
jgi:diguanylate cyclase (GGDEF)-like protein/PAS domain S-box-containing protein